MEKREIKISVRNLVEFVLRSGDIDNRITGAARPVEGTKAHQKIQKAYKDGYQAEVPLKLSIQYKDINITVEGRADGLLKDDTSVTVDEIKTTTRDLKFIDENYNELHWAQAKCYGYIYALDNNVANINIQLTYFNLDTEEIKHIKNEYTFQELEEFFYDVIKKYYVWAKLSSDWEIIRDNTIKDLPFPYESYRNGQREMAVFVFRTIKNEKKFFVHAPTGIGKTMSTLYPSIKALGEGYNKKIFYLTAKTITRTVAEQAVKIMSSIGLRIKSTTITAKDKICFNEKTSCNPVDCKFAKGHFDRVNAALMDIFNNEDEFTREKIESYSKKHVVCPFEFSLDLTVLSDCIICDYNYVFDPRVYLKRFFSEGRGDYTFLVDEAHNLVERAREMFSAVLCKKDILKVKKDIKDKIPKASKALNKINLYMVELRKQCNENNVYINKEDPLKLYGFIRSFTEEMEEYILKNREEEIADDIMQLYFQCLNFNKVGEIYDERYITYGENSREDFKLKLYCMDPSYLLSESVKKGKSTVFFSGTLIPMQYFKEILGGDKEDYSLHLKSPFDKKNRSLIIADKVSTKYKYRDSSYEKITKYIESFTRGKQGNYMVFFPSYAYMINVHEVFTEKFPNIKTIIQSSEMSEEERTLFLDSFVENPVETNIGFCVLGGIFSEGIDLPNDRLIGAVIVGVGLPQICAEKNIIKDYFNEKNSMGYEYAYMYPGMNKVLQAAGRVIRGENDRGAILLIDDRFTSRSYQRLFPEEWFPFIKVSNPNQVETIVNRMWKE